LHGGSIVRRHRSHAALTTAVRLVIIVAADVAFIALHLVGCTRRPLSDGTYIPRSFCIARPVSSQHYGEVIPARRHFPMPLPLKREQGKRSALWRPRDWRRACDPVLVLMTGGKPAVFVKVRAGGRI